MSRLTFAEVANLLLAEDPDVACGSASDELASSSAEYTGPDSWTDARLGASDVPHGQHQSGRSGSPGQAMTMSVSRHPSGIASPSQTHGLVLASGYATAHGGAGVGGLAAHPCGMGSHMLD